MANPANRYQLSCTGVSLEYLASDIGGQPSLNLRIDGRDISARGHELQVESTWIGTLVSVSLPFAAVPDSKTETFSALLPAARVDGGPVEIATAGIRTIERTAISPDLVTGQVQTYEVMMLRGQASVVEA